MGKTEHIKDPVRLNQILTNDKIDFDSLNYFDINDALLQVNYKYKNEFKESNYKTNIFIAAFTTALARLKLYETLELLGEQVLYCDTDSIIYKYMPGTKDIKINTYDNRLGYFKDEMADEYGPGKYITEFVSGGPKNYAFKVNDGSVKSKIKARDSSFNSLQKLNFDTVKCFILNAVFEGEKDKQIKYDHLQFKKNKYDKSITIEPVEKSYNFTYDKRKIIINTDNKNIIDTLPFSNKG